MTENEIRSSITNKINQGQLKSSLYDEFKKEINVDALRNILASRPSYELWKKYKKAHLVLLIIWGFYMLLELLGIFDLMVIFDMKIFRQIDL